MLQHGHAAADMRNLELHRVALDKLRAFPQLTERCLELLDRWLSQPECRPALQYLERWREMLSGWSVDRIAAVVLDPEGGQALRQSSPLGPALSPQERWAVLRTVNQGIDRAVPRSHE
jgi:hypothetical protein